VSHKRPGNSNYFTHLRVAAQIRQSEGLLLRRRAAGCPHTGPRAGRCPTAPPLPARASVTRLLNLHCAPLDAPPSPLPVCSARLPVCLRALVPTAEPTAHAPQASRSGHPPSYPCAIGRQADSAVEPSPALITAPTTRSPAPSLLRRIPHRQSIPSDVFQISLNSIAGNSMGHSIPGTAAHPAGRFGLCTVSAVHTGMSAATLMLRPCADAM